MQRLTFPFPFVHHQSHVYQQPRPSGTTINRGNEDWMLLMNEIDTSGSMKETLAAGLNGNHMKRKRLPFHVTAQLPIIRQK